MPNSATAIRALERLSRALPSRDRVSVHLHEDWDQEVSSAYRELDGEAWLPEAVLEKLIANQRTHTKRVALLHRDRRIWALVPLRLTGTEWQPLIRGLVDGMDDFVCSGHPESVLAALRLNLFVPHSPVNPTSLVGVRWAGSIQSYELSLSEHPENHWRSKDRLTTITQARRRCEQFELVRDDPQSIRWTIQRWHERFFTGDIRAISSKWEDRLTIAEWGLGSGLIRSWALRDGERWVAGAVTDVREGRLTFSTIYRDPEYNWHSAGTRLLAEGILWAYESGLAVADLCGDLEYKRWWAPPAGQRWHYGISPLPVYAVKGPLGRIASLRKRES